jgi:hypothetical protein
MCPDWILNILEYNYLFRILSKVGEAKVYLHTDNKSVIKLNDTIYYATWPGFFTTQFTFPGTAIILFVIPAQ